jgi:hypothetical protein
VFEGVFHPLRSLCGSLNAAESTLKSATQLLGQLSGENERWGNEVSKLKQAMD